MITIDHLAARRLNLARLVETAASTSSKGFSTALMSLRDTTGA
jgi:hypothetical protein